MATKPIVDIQDWTIVYGRLVGIPSNHPGNNGMVSNTTHIITSSIVAIDRKLGRVETQNTVYHLHGPGDIMTTETEGCVERLTYP